MTSASFTPAKDRHTYVKVTPLVAGFITPPEAAFISPVDPTVKTTIPCMCFVVDHPTKRLMFDLGLRSDPRNYIPEIQKHLAANRQPATHRPSADEILRANNIAPESIETVILSHVHWDHHGDPTSFPNASFYVGQGSLGVLSNNAGHGAHAHFDPNLFNHNEHHELSEPVIDQSILTGPGRGLESLVGKKGDKGAAPAWQSLGLFPFAADVFGDSSVYIVSAPGHLPGHVNLLCRVDETKWVYLAGDAFHDTRLLTGEKEISTWEENGQICCVHVDREQAMASIVRIRDMVKMMESEGMSVEIIASHDAPWYEKNKKRLMSVSTAKPTLASYATRLVSALRRIVCL